MKVDSLFDVLGVGLSKLQNIMCFLIRRIKEDRRFSFNNSVYEERKHHVLVASAAKGCCKILGLSCRWQYQSSWVYFNLRIWRLHQWLLWSQEVVDGLTLVMGAHFCRRTVHASCPHPAKRGCSQGLREASVAEEAWEADIHLSQNWKLINTASYIQILF